MLEGAPMFLDNESLKNRVLLATFPRTGNSFLRQYFEQITNIVTGSDMDFSLTQEVGLNGFKGEAYIDDRVWIQKTHHPMDTYHIGQSKGNRLISTIRNPLDTVVSCYELFCTDLQSYCFPDQYYEEKRDHFWKFAQSNLIAYLQHTKSLIKECQDEGVQLYFIRYEDLLENPSKTLHYLFKFLINVDDIEGTLLQSRIEKAITKMNNGQQAIYKVQKKGINKHRQKFTQEMIDWISKELHWFNHFFGYTKIKSKVENCFDIFQYEEEDCSSEIHLQFLDHNKMAIQQSQGQDFDKWFTTYRPEHIIDYIIEFQGFIGLP
ncbi:fbox domain containing protein [Stylonychia lemnae]|uniref:Fbox domain containing protein n=1 Tax=Stylonychia lemnae TaxID=5949 RepID=A0A078A2P1_STYLE|nr:fbox domain containing protein [Stylonychia lemnae]|eukprot:CDW75049.1 fbox domain containing protein [Stylonychia lemnae]